MADEIAESPDLGSGTSEAGGVVSTGESVQPSEHAPVQDGIETPAVDATQTDVSDADEYADLRDPEDEQPADPAAPVAQPELPAPVAEALTLSPYVTKAEDIPDAVRASAEVWDVQTGKADAGEFIDKFRASGDPAAFNRVVNQVRSYLAWAESNGIIPKAGEQPAEDPAVAELRGKVQTFEQQQRQQQQEASRRVEAEATQKVVTSLQAKLTDLTSQPNNAWLAGDNGIHQAVLAKMDENKVDPKIARTDYGKYESEYVKAFKQVKNAQLEQFKARSAAILKTRTALAASTPAAPGSNAPPRDSTGKFKPSTGKPSGIPKREDYPEGEDGRMKWSEDYWAATEPK